MDKSNDGMWREYSLVEHLKNLCSNNEKYKNLYAVWTLNQETYSKELSAISYNFPHYSMHDESHSLSIINKIEMLLGEDRIKSLGPTDTFLILESAYLHDMGMILGEKELLEKWKEPTFKQFLENLKENSYDVDTIEAATYILEAQESKGKIFKNDWPVKVRRYVTIISAEYYRSKHNFRSANFIKDGNDIVLNPNFNKLIPNRLILLLQKIAISHGVGFEESFYSLEQFDNGIGTDIIHPRFIASLLRLGDLLDLDDGRFNEVFGKVAYLPQTSENHKEKHRSITLFLVSPEKIQVSAVCNNTEVYRETRAWFDWLKEEVKNLSSRWSDIVPRGFKGGPPSLGDIKLSIEGAGNITDQLDLQFNIDPKRAFEFIEGQGIYSDKFVFIRELIQNAMDATKIQMWKDIKGGRFDGISEELIGITQERLDEIKDKINFEFPDDLPEKIKKYYPINIEINYDEKNEELSFSIDDRGCGIGINDLKRMENVGESWNQDEKMAEFINDMPEFLKPTGNFGIGLHSVFLVTNQLYITTKPEDDKAYNLVFVSRRKNGYITVEENNKKRTIGSKIYLKIKSKEKIFKYINTSIIKKLMLEDEYEDEHYVDFFEKKKKYDYKIIITDIVEVTKSFLGHINIFNIYINKEPININKSIQKYKIKGKLDEFSHFKVLEKDILDIKIEDKKEGIIINSCIDRDCFKKDGLSMSINNSIIFKEIICSKMKVEINIPYIRFNINLYKGDTKSILNISREEIEEEKWKFINARVCELFIIAIEKLGFYINEIEKDIKENYTKYENSLIIFLCLYSIYIGKDFRFRDKEIEKSIYLGEMSIIEEENLKNYEITYDKILNLEKIFHCYSTDSEKIINDKKRLIEKERVKVVEVSNKIIISQDYIDYVRYKIFKMYLDKNFKPYKIINGSVYFMCRKEYFKECKELEIIDNNIKLGYITTMILSEKRRAILHVKSKNSYLYNLLLININIKNTLFPINKLNDDEEKYITVENLILDNLIWQGFNFIISPIYNMNKNYLKSKTIDEIIKFLKKERYFNELIDWVAENSIEKENYTGENIKEDIEKAYIVFIQECIDIISGLDENTIIEKYENDIISDDKDNE